MSTTKSQKENQQSATVAKIRDAAKTTKLGAKVFSRGNEYYKTSAGELELISLTKNIFAAAGIDLPTGAKVTLDGAQIILAGGIVVDRLQDGAKIGQVAAPAGIAISGVTSLLGNLGLLSPGFQRWSNFGASVALICLSPATLGIGAVVGAILSFIAVWGDITTGLFGSYEAAVNESKQLLFNRVTEKLTPQIEYAQAQAELYAAGKLNPFDLINNIASNSPNVFKNLFPDLYSYFPNWVSTLTATATSSGLFKSETHSEKYEFTNILKESDEQVRRILLRYYVTKPMQGFLRDRMPSNKISLKALSTLSMMLTANANGSSQRMGIDFPVIDAMRYLGVTPAWLGDEWLFEGRMSRSGVLSSGAFGDEIFPYRPLTLPEAKLPSTWGSNNDAISVNGFASRPPSDTAKQVYYDKLRAFQIELKNADINGEMEKLYSNREARAMLENWAQVDVEPTWDKGNPEPANYILKPGRVPISKQKWFDAETAYAATFNMEFLGTKALENLKSGRASKYALEMPTIFSEYVKQNYFIDISNYWKSLSILKVMGASELFKNDASALNEIGSMDEIENQFRMAYDTMLCKQINNMARQNVANYLDVPLAKLSSGLTENGSVVFEEKG